MKNIYSFILKFVVAAFMILHCCNTYAQCPGGYVPGGVAYDTTVSTGSGSYSTVFKFPKFNPDSGLLRCIRVCITITGRVTMALENNVTNPATYNIVYDRADTLTGPGLAPPLTNSITVPYGPYNLDASDGVAFSGPDFVSIGPDTVLNSVTFCRMLTDSVSMVPFYGYDSVEYTYSIKAGATVVGSGDYLFSVSTQGSVRYQLEYCYCPSFVLPLTVQNFYVTKTANDKAELSWQGLDDNDNSGYHYEVEMSRDGRDFSVLSSVQRSEGLTPYRYGFTSGINHGRFYFRIKQVYANGYTRFTEIKTVDLDNSIIPKIKIYPNPSNGLVGIKFDDISSGKFLVEIFNTQGQTVFSREIEVSGNSYRQITTLQRGMYWLRLSDVTSHLSCVNQLLIK